VTSVVESSLEELDYELELPCACKKFCNPDYHPAAFWITLSCGCCYPFCQRALSISNLRLKVRPLTCRRCQAVAITIRSVIRI
jgi:hypothetical protein